MLGMNSDCPVTASTWTTRSHQPPARAAASTPSGIPSSAEISSAEPTSSSVHGNRSSNESVTGMLWLNETPRFPCSSSPMYLKYCTGMGWFSPYASISSARISGVMLVLAMAVAGSPGSSLSNRKVTVTANQMVSRPRPTLLSTNTNSDMYSAGLGRRGERNRVHDGQQLAGLDGEAGPAVAVGDVEVLGIHD